MTARDIAANITRIVPLLMDASKDAVDEIAEEIFEESTEIYCPVLTGFLKGSATNKVTSAGVIYARTIEYSADYAEKVHEIYTPHNNPPTASWKYLEIPYNHIAPQLPSRIKKKLGGMLK
jgi:hypothetical protein